MVKIRKLIFTNNLKGCLGSGEVNKSLLSGEGFTALFTPFLITGATDSSSMSS
jgi:hypothetical protein